MHLELKACPPCREKLGWEACLLALIRRSGPTRQVLRVDKNIAPIYGDLRPGDIKHSYAKIELINEKIGIKPICDFKERIESVNCSLLVF